MRHQLIQRTVFVLSLFLLVACSTTTAEPTPIPATATLEPAISTPKPPTPTRRPLGRTSTDQITSQALAENLLGDSATRRFGIYLPPGYETSEDRYPVVFALHGWRGDYQELSGMSKALNSLIDAGEAREMIIVYPDGGNAFWGSWYRSSPTIGDYEAYITSELVEYIDANYRTIPNRESRGITGCSMGGDGAIHLAFKYPEVFSVAAPVSGFWDFDLENNDLWEAGREAFAGEPDDLNMRGEPWLVVWFMGGAAIAAPNPDKPPFYLDMPYEVANGEGQIVTDVYEKIVALAPKHEVHDYLAQPVRLSGLLLVQEEVSVPAVAESGRNFDQLLTELGVEHEYLEVDSGHCDGAWHAPVLKFMTAHLEF